MKTLNQYGEYNFFGHNKLKIGKIIIYNTLIILVAIIYQTRSRRWGKPSAGEGIWITYIQ